MGTRYVCVGVFKNEVKLGEEGNEEENVWWQVKETKMKNKG